jgi:NhaA family Na+:H+ antiporter
MAEIYEKKAAEHRERAQLAGAPRDGADRPA